MAKDARLGAAGAAARASRYRSDVMAQIGSQKNQLQFNAQMYTQRAKSLNEQLKTDQDALTKAQKEGTDTQDMRNRVTWDQNKLNEIDWQLKQTQQSLKDLQSVMTGAMGGAGEAPLEGGAAEEGEPTTQTTTPPPDTSGDQFLNNILPPFNE
jgi:hypothetical protein